MSDLRMFRRVCYEAARGTGGEVTEFRVADTVAPSFHQGIIAYRDRTVAVVCVRDAALLAIAVPRAAEGASDLESGPLTFVDDPDLAAALRRAPGFRVLTPAELGGRFDADEWPGISSSDIRYWQPGCLGEALFNYWD